MQINLNTNTDSTNFQALYMPSRFKLSSLKNSEIFDVVKDPLKDMANDVDIYVKSKGIFDDGFTIKVAQVTKSPIKRFFGMIGETIFKDLKHEDILQFNGGVSDLILSKAQEAKNEYLGFKDYFTKS